METNSPGRQKGQNPPGRKKEAGPWLLTHWNVNKPLWKTGQVFHSFDP